MAAGFHYVRGWCDTCMKEATFRRFGDDSQISAKVECAEHGQAPRSVDWVALACAGIDATAGQFAATR